MKTLSRPFLMLLLLVPVATIFVGGCKRSDDAFDNRPLERRPHVETVTPEDRKDAFRP